MIKNCDPRWLNVIGLVCDMAGASFLAYGLIISKKQAITLGSFYLMAETDEENVKVPPIQDLLKQSKNAKIGLVLLVLGFLLQIFGNWRR